jgi:hypothetical protein
MHTNVRNKQITGELSGKILAASEVLFFCYFIEYVFFVKRTADFACFLSSLPHFIPGQILAVPYLRGKPKNLSQVNRLCAHHKWKNTFFCEKVRCDERSMHHRLIRNKKMDDIS